MSTMTRPMQALTYARVMSGHPRPSQEIAKEIMRRAGQSPRPRVTSLVFHGTGGDRALAAVTWIALARLP
jgi:hypothetical protein